MRKEEFIKNEERLRNFQDIFKRSNIGIIGVPEGEEEEQEIGNLFENIMKENFPNVAKERVGRQYRAHNTSQCIYSAIFNF